MFRASFMFLSMSPSNIQGKVSETVVVLSIEMERDNDYKGRNHFKEYMKI